MGFNVTWRGASGKSYTFKTFPKGTEFNPVSGVYVFTRMVLGGSWEALYVGETGNLAKRLNEGIDRHDGYRRANALGATHIAALLVAGDAERLRIETDLRHGLRPSGNLQSIPARTR